LNPLVDTRAPGIPCCLAVEPTTASIPTEAATQMLTTASRAACCRGGSLRRAARMASTMGNQGSRRIPPKTPSTIAQAISIRPSPCGRRGEP
jgi:hypothetical protein